MLNTFRKMCKLMQIVDALAYLAEEGRIPRESRRVTGKKL